MPFTYTKDLVNNAFTYEEYRNGINETLTSPPVGEQEQKMRPYLENNVSLMDSFDKGYKVSDELKAAINAAPPSVWLVLTEGWCGDAAFNVPMLAAVERELPDKVRLKLLLRDDNLELMDAHLTNGGRSIPKLIVLSRDLKELGTWGPRPEELQKLMKGWKKEGLALEDLIPKVHDWYNSDNTQSMQEELKKLVQSYS